MAFGIIIALFFAGLMETTHQRFHQAATQRQAQDWAKSIVSRFHTDLASAIVSSMDSQSLLSTLADTNPSASFYLLDRSGSIIGASMPLTALSQKAIALAPIHELMASRAELPITIADPAKPSSQRIFSVAGIGQPTAPTAYLLMLLRAPETTGFLAAYTNFLFSDSLFLAAGVTGPAIASAMLLSFMILLPVRRLSRSIASLESEHDDRHPFIQPTPPANAHSELDQLNSYFAAMAQWIEDLLRSQKAEDRKRRELFANLSHDLRTPITVIECCLEPLVQNDADLSPGKAHEMTAAALSQTRALAHLVESIFDLATLHSPDCSLCHDVFPIAEVLADVVLKFFAKAQSLGKTIALQVAEHDRGLRVHADPMLIERALDNLIDNALKHAAGATQITLALDKSLAGVEISIIDNGCGIPMEIQATHFADHRISEFNYHSGRGLRIVQRILELHGSTLVLYQSDERGTVFRFELPARSRVLDSSKV
ncbi:MAG: HAMP domain-containing histidine kinase [Gammaproteobacteria bacterium]|nr:HAMP domain-containing histidine kinase [Gammaproteobacteria bacterium]MBU1846384.1 HAMP domain-containing histidine kinase [Gammaproteobacteria bacterium]